MARYALVVGITDYKSPINNLTKPATDAEAVEQVLRAHGDFENIDVLKGKVSTTKLAEALKTLLQQQAVKKEALIYFTGHGITVSDSLGTQQAYLATSDLTIVTQGKQIIEQTGGISLLSLNNLIRDSDLSSLVVLLDCCHSGYFLENNLLKTTFTAINLETNYYFIVACRPFQEAYANKSAQHSIFSTALLAGLSPEKANQHGQVTSAALFDNISAELKRSGQQPIQMGWGSSITLVTYNHQRQVQTFEVKEECPYQGLKAFEAEQKEFFFGRKQVIREILAKFNEKPFVPIIGASGSGKSSVVRAGLIPELLNNRGWRVIEPIKPGFEPLEELRTAFKQCFKQANKQKQFQTLSNNYPNNLPEIIENLPGAEKLLLVVDQFEEVFTGGASQQEKQRFIDLLTQVVEITDSRLAVVITMRADFLEPCLQYPSLTQLIQTQAVFMPPLTGVDLKDSIAEPAKLQGHSVEEGLILKIFEDVKQEPGFLPLLEFALTKLWEKRDRNQHQLTLEEYEKLGELTGALNLHAENVYLYRDFEEELPTQKRTQQEKEWIGRIFLRLVRTGEGEKDTRQRQPKATLLNIAGDDANQQQELSELLDGEAGLVKGRLLVTGKDEKGKAWIDLAHEALIEGWQQFAWWRQQDRDLRRLSDRLEDARREWVNKGENDKYLMQGGLLAEVRNSWQQLQPHLQSPQEDEDFYQRSDTHEKDHIAELERALTESRLREKAARVENLLTVQPLESLVLAIQAMGENQEKLPQQILAPVQYSLNRVMNKARVSIPLCGHEGDVISVAISADGQTIVSGGEDGTVRLWNLQGLPLTEPFRGHEGDVWSVAVSADGQTIVSGGEDGTVRLWNLQGQTLAEPFRGHEGDVRSVAISADGQTIVSGGEDCTVQLWNLQGQTLAEPFRGHESEVYSVAISADGQTIVSGGKDGTVRLWNLQGLPLTEPFRGHEGEVYSVAISADGQTIVSGGKDGTVRLWNLQGLPLTEPFRGHEGDVWSVAISADGQTIVSGGEDGTVRLWNLQGQTLTEPFRGHKSEVYSVAISADGQTIVSGGEDGTVRLWNLQGLPLTEPFRGHECYVWSVAISADGQTIVSGGSDGTVRLWNLQGQTLAEPLRGHGDYVNSVTISADGQTIVSGGKDGTVRLWNLQGQTLAEPFPGHEDYVNSVAISADGRTIVSGGKDGTVRLWNLQGQTLAEPFPGHEGDVISVVISADGQTIVSGGLDGTVRLWNLQGQTLAEPLRGHEGWVISVVISADGQTIVSGGSDGTVRLWNLQGQTLAEPLRGHEGWVYSVAISADGQTVVSGGEDGTVRLWNLQGLPLTEPFRGHEGDVRSVAISADGQTIVSSGEDGTVRLWRGGWCAWLQVCCDRLRYHPIFTNPQTEEAKAACEVCRKYVWSKEHG
ncbi:nSTAND1 domain-containing NTPase [Nostoc sp. 'Peltigera membranacea cyanobiont' N6]|uniref:nSTAND1 domain-containing NTPase n=1 Tax=Nostoc sp. 'Peltigera membranacea cyanobiont' N6 TaxID=1261031 RepID=UPI000CF30372|nr:caspase family protein [Nostoc sp. 'Peltigera membranacea cyanobiont' N6]AVH66666.1 WD40 repeat-containing protein [Nostoc sp. 'Peltigera membranacea cyanobiont' N6]